jgi:hypothetical protein
VTVHRVATVGTQSSIVTERGAVHGAAGAPPWLPLAVGLAVSVPVLVALVVMTREPWFPVGDFAHMVFRTSQVGTADTPLVGAYSTKGWAHPGPMLFWLAAPFYRISGGDPRSVEWATAAINVGCIVAVSQLAWRRGGAALLVATGLFAALLVHGIGARPLVLFWNPYVPLLPFLLTVALVWDAGLGRWRSVALAVIPASIAMQGHLAFVVLVGALVVWFAAWTRWCHRLVPADGNAAGRLSPGPLRRVRRAAPWWLWAVAALMWAAPAVDAVLDHRNPLRIARSFAHPSASAGPVRAVSLVGRYVRPDGPWVGGAEPLGADLSVRGSGPVPLVVALAALWWCLRAGRRRRLPDVVALTTLTLSLLIVAVPATAQIVLPAALYLTAWLKVVGALVWFAVVWTAWRVVEPRVRHVVAGHGRTATAVAGAAVVVAVTVSVPAAADAEQPAALQSAAVLALGPQLEANVPRDERLRVEARGDFTATTAPAVIYWLIDRGYDVVTSDSAAGLKWGHTHLWERGDDHDLVMTAAVNRAVDECDRDPSVRRIAGYDGLTTQERRRLSEIRFRRLDGPDALTAAEADLGRSLSERDLRLAVFTGPDVCGSRNRVEFGEPTRGVLVPTVVAGVVCAALAAPVIVVVRRRRGRGAAGRGAGAGPTT